MPFILGQATVAVRVKITFLTATIPVFAVFVEVAVIAALRHFLSSGVIGR